MATTPVAPTVDAPPESSVSESQVSIHQNLKTIIIIIIKIVLKVYYKEDIVLVCVVFILLTYNI